jgi:glycogen synthase
MRIVFVVEAYYPLVGGGAFAVQNIAKVLMKMGHHISIVADRYSNRLPRREVIDQATVYRVWFIMPTTEILLTLKSIWRFI